jgi:CheY-like chemotaxis protein
MNVKDWTVCVIEPNKFEGQIILDLLRNAGVDKVKVFTTPEHAIDTLEVYNANIVIASFEMAPLDGAAWTRAYRRNHKLPGRKQAIFITSGAFSLAMAEKCRHAAAKVLTATINKVLSQPREFIDAEGYVGPCRRAGIVTAGAPKKRRKVDDSDGASAAAVQTLEQIVEALAGAAAQLVLDPRNPEACETALRHVQAYAVNAGDGPLMRACAAFALQLSSWRSMRAEAARAALDACMNGVAHLAATPVTETAAREAVAEGVRQAVAKAAMQRAA